MHDLDSKVARRIIATVGLIASLVLLCASGLMNWRFGCSLGRSPLDCQVYGWASASGDLLLATAPFFFFAALSNREVVRTLAALIVWLMCLSFAAASAIGHAAANRLDSTGVREVAATSYADTRAELEQARKDRGFVPDIGGRNEAGIRAEIERHKVSVLWTRSNECTEINGKQERGYCATYQQLQADLGNAMQAAKLDERISMLTTRSDQLGSGSTAVKSEADPQAKIIAFLSGMNLKTVQGWLAALVAAMILSCAGLGPYVSLAILAPRRRIYVPVEMPQGKTTTIDIPAGPALPAPAKVVKTAMLPSPTAPKMHYVPRPEPIPEGRRLLTAIGYPGAPQADGSLRAKDERVHLGPRFLTWLAVYNLKGDHTAEQVDELYAEFAANDHREAWGMRIVKSELMALKKWVWTTQSRTAAKDGKARPTVWTIAPPTLPKLREFLTKKGVVQKTPDPPSKGKDKGGTVLPFSEAVSEQTPAPNESPATEAAEAPKAKGPVKGMAELQRRVAPNLDSLRHLARAQKAEWQRRLWSRDRKQTNRFSRARPAA